MSDRHDVTNALRAAEILRVHTPPPTVFPGPGERTAAVAALEAVLKRRGRVRQVRWAAGGTLAAAAAAVAVFLGLRFIPGPAAPPVVVEVAPVLPVATVTGGEGQILGSSGVHPAVAGAEVRPGERMAAHTRSLQAKLAHRARLELQLGELEVVEWGAVERLHLSRGSVRLQVAKLSAGERFLVGTSDSEVEVHGTTFSVSVVDPASPCAGGISTRVSVEEGVVTVRHRGQDIRLSPGMKWPTCAPAPPVAPVSPVVKAPARRPPPTPQLALVPVVPDPPPETPPPPDPSTLSEQNDLFAAAIDARRRGDLTEARRQIEDLLVRFPRGPLAGAAAAERRKLRRLAEQN